MKKIILCFLVLLFVSCGIDYDGETKLVVKGIIVDENNQPIANNDIKLVVSISDTPGYIYGGGSEYNYIGRTISKADGSYTMIIPAPSNFGQIEVETNSQENSYNKKQFVNIQLTNFVNYELNLPETKLYRKDDLSNLFVTLNNVTTNYQIQKIEYIGAIANEEVFINPIAEIDFPYNTYSRVKKNQTLILRYTVKNISNNENLIFEENIVIGNQSEINYTLNY